MDWQIQIGRLSIAVWPWTEYPSCYGRFWPCLHFEMGIEFIIPITGEHSFHFCAGW